MYDSPRIYLYYFFAYISIIQIQITNSNSCFKLENNKIIRKHEFIERNGGKEQFLEDAERQTNLLFDIISTTTTISSNFNYFWIKSSHPLNDDIFGDLIKDERIEQLLFVRNNTNYELSSAADKAGLGDTTNTDYQQSSIQKQQQSQQSQQQQYEILDCGKPVNFTFYDHLIGVAERFNHPRVPEPEVAYYFLKKVKGSKSLKNFDIEALERRLKKAKREKPRSVQLYNQIGNFWRIKGDARQSIECFRRALAVSPSNAEVLLNLARVLFNLQYLDDAIHLTRRSLEVQPPDRSAWRQYFTLGEIFKAYGHFQESILHLKHALELFPGHEKIKQALRDVENIPTSSLNVYTILIIIFLILCVLLVIVSTTDGNQNAELEPKIPRIRSSFNRAIAMSKINTQRSIRRK